MPKLIEVVTHAYAKHFSFYADALCYHLSSLVLDRPENCKVQITVCFDPSDDLTLDVIDWFCKETDLYIYKLPLTLPYLGRLAIGRNLAAKRSEADIVWFSDVDQCFREGILDRLAGMEWPEKAVMVFPQRIKIHRTHSIGDTTLKRVEGNPQLIDVDPEDFVPKKYHVAIGGTQIVRGDFVRQNGYLDKNTRWQQPVKANKKGIVRFDSCKCDVAYRQQVCQRHGRTVEKIDLDGLYRIRHTIATHEATDAQLASE